MSVFFGLCFLNINRTKHAPLRYPHTPWLLVHHLAPGFDLFYIPRGHWGGSPMAVPWNVWEFQSFDGRDRNRCPLHGGSYKPPFHWGLCHWSSQSTKHGFNCGPVADDTDISSASFNCEPGPKRPCGRQDSAGPTESAGPPSHCSAWR